MLTSENKFKEGRHVGLDFYDLLIEALKTRLSRLTEAQSAELASRVVMPQKNRASLRCSSLYRCEVPALVGCRRPDA
jgi:hypothetical protein